MMIENGILNKPKLREQLWFKVLFALFAGVIVGVLMGQDLALMPHHIATSISEWLALPGYLFMTLLKFIVIPLVISSVMLGICDSSGSKALKTLGSSVGFILFTTTIATTIALSLTFLIEPGAAVDNRYFGGTGDSTINPINIAENGALGIIKGIMPGNLFYHMSNADMLQIVVAAIIIGLALLNMAKDDSMPLIALMRSVQKVCMTIVIWLMKYTPIVVFGLILNTVVQMGLGAIVAVSMFFATVVLGMLCMVLVYMLIIAILTPHNPLTFIKNCREVIAFALATSSSSATMPVTLRVTETLHKVRPQISRLVIPLGTTVNMDGTAIFQATAVVFIAQAFGVDLTTTQLIIISLLAIVASIGAPGIPSGSLPILAGTLASQGLPVEGMALVIGVDRLLDMGRGVINILGDMTSATVLNTYIKEDTVTDVPVSDAG
ncbi:dicarboxylate/amino acid:cation symporter [Thalassotalea sp. HSM 43]|uniref:dicarboxylate/amino acid:cation symporter n=1 Tax=Thalassotalea sp. HSM 43 TaxID=2552945 RepID=UPI001081F6A4|nr:dicarboxylate/amino acid:cation symporter [Thalassotalea sp. HSM 43]QBY05755.1 dicarboxylate/amino acid:cation symporter [Thalassotalea sp. HSM 43]